MYVCVRTSRESNGMRECDTAKLTRAAAQGLVPIPTVGDAYFMYPQRWAPLVLAHGAVLLGRGGMSWLRAHVRSGVCALVSLG